MEDDGDNTKDDNFYLFDFDDDLNELVGVQEFFQGVHEKITQILEVQHSKKLTSYYRMGSRIWMRRKILRRFWSFGKTCL